MSYLLERLYIFYSEICTAASLLVVTSHAVSSAIQPGVPDVWLTYSEILACLAKYIPAGQLINVQVFEHLIHIRM